jgi:PBP1b-binding outer membrane lipoprotein LpoB
MLKIATIFFLMLILGGCYTFTGTTLPPHLKTVQVDPVINQTLDPVLAEKLTQAIINGFQSRSTLRIVNENGHCRFTAVLKKYSHEVYNNRYDGTCKIF